jgi:hypothetical protein
MSNVQVGRYLYKREELPMCAKVLAVLASHKNGISVHKVTENAEILAVFGNDRPRTIQRVGLVLNNLRFRRVVSMTLVNGEEVWNTANVAEANEIIAKGKEIALIIKEKCANVKETTVVSETNEVSNSSKKVKNMTTVTKATKAPKLFLNPETNKVEPFGPGRPSKVKTACACNAEGKYLNPQLAAAFLQNGGKTDDKLTKDELVNLVRQLRAEVETLNGQKEALEKALVSALNPEPAQSDAETPEGTESETDEGDEECGENCEGCEDCGGDAE